MRRVDQLPGHRSLEVRCNFGNYILISLYALSFVTAIWQRRLSFVTAYLDNAASHKHADENRHSFITFNTWMYWTPPFRQTHQIIRKHKEVFSSAHSCGYGLSIRRFEYSLRLHRQGLLWCQRHRMALGRSTLGQPAATLCVPDGDGGSLRNFGY
jgi:hypothetical protein